MALQISDTTPRIQYTATSGQTTFAVNFEFFNVADLKVYNGTTLLTYNNSPSSALQYSVTGAGVTGGGSITLGSPGATLNDKITIVRDLAIERISDFPVSGNFPIQTLNTELDKIVAMLQQLEEQFARTLQYPVTTTTGFNVDLPDLVANRVLSVNSDATALLAEQELGTFKGNWAASTSYQIRDLVKDTSTGNIFFVNAAHTSSGSEPLTTNANSAKYDLIVDAASATTSATNAASSATAASTSATAAANSATAAATSETNAATSESNASTSESNASTSATAASNSATAAGTSATNAATSETNAANSATAAATSATNSANSASAASTSETNAANSATAAAASAVDATNNGAVQVALATTQATNAATSATNAATSETNAATSASNASTSETNAANSATSSATSATNANTSATNASNSASAAAASAASAANSYDQFDDRYLGTKTSDPTLDNDGNALVAGALYFNSNANEMRVYDGGNWIPASSAGSVSLNLYEYTATAGQTTFSGTDDKSATLSYSLNNLIVTLNGITLDPDDFTATSGTSIVLNSAAALNDILNVYAFKSFTVSELNANNLTDGIIPDARFPATLPALNGSALTNLTSGNLTGALPAIDGSALTGIESGIAWQSLIKTSSFTAVANEGYWIDTSSNTVTITLPSSASVGDTIELVDYARTWGTNKIIIDSNGLNFQGDPDTYDVEYSTSGKALRIVYSGATKGWIPIFDQTFSDKPVAPDYSINYLIIAGGGSGGSQGGGGGAGGYITNSITVSSGTTYNFVVGAGGAQSGTGQGDSGNNGSNSTGFSQTAIGGGGGGSRLSGPGNGGSGGGVNGAQTSTPGSGTAGQGNNGGLGNTSINESSGGGGGAGAVGGNSGSTTGGSGGAGSASSITGSSVTRAGGGGGSLSSATGSGGTGGSGGGGNGDVNNNGSNTAGSANTGGGGGGASYTRAGKAGGSGVVILSIPTANYTGTTSGSPTVTTSGSNTILTYNASGSYTS